MVVTEPTCTEGGYTTHTCDICGFTYVDDFKDPLGHDWGAWIEDDESTHTRTCARCGETETEVHDWSEYVFNNDAGLFRNGTKTTTCNVCGATHTEKAHHTSWICRVFYPIGLFICNFFNKIVIALSLNWLFPTKTIPYTI